MSAICDDCGLPYPDFLYLEVSFHSCLSSLILQRIILFPVNIEFLQNLYSNFKSLKH
jgi:hypothetical protein